MVGMPDLIAMKNGRFFMFELKAPGGRIKAEQISRLIEWQKSGALCSIVVTTTGWFSSNNPQIQGIEVF
jgi:Holliday junction resolvase